MQDFALSTLHALSRQLDEAIFIRSFGNLNTKNEFASNELIRLESTQYSWEEEKLTRLNSRKEKEFEESLKFFIVIMENINKLSSKRKSPDTATNNDISRYINKRKKMQSSTPVDFKTRREFVLPSSPIDGVELELANLNIISISVGEDSRSNNGGSRVES